VGEGDAGAQSIGAPTSCAREPRQHVACRRLARSEIGVEDLKGEKIISFSRQNLSDTERYFTKKFEEHDLSKSFAYTATTPSRWCRWSPQVLASICPAASSSPWRWGASTSLAFPRRGVPGSRPRSPADGLALL